MTRILRAVVLSGIALLLVAFSFVQIEQHLLRYRAEHLLADFQSIRLHQSTWADAQTLMRRWGAWGHYDGRCTASDCVYAIMLADPTSRIANYIKSDTGWLLMRRTVELYEFFGGRPGWLTVRFVVQDGAIWRSTVGLLLDVPPHAEKDDDYGYSLMLLARASDSLHEKPDGPWILGTDDQLADHPNYKEGRPSGCEGCISSEVTFTPYISAAELKQVTSYDLSCFTRFRHCRELPDVLPIARDWYLNPTQEPAYKAPSSPTMPRPCAIPVYARSRDASSIMLVDAISSTITTRKSGDEKINHVSIQTTKVRLVETLKGTSPFEPGKIFNAIPFPGGDSSSPLKGREQFEPGKRYIILPADVVEPSSPVYTGYCGLIEGTPSILNQVSQGLAQNDSLHRPELFGGAIY